MECLIVNGYSGESSMLASFRRLRIRTIRIFTHTNIDTLTVALTCGGVFIKRPGAFELLSSFRKGTGGFYEHKTGC